MGFRIWVFRAWGFGPPVSEPCSFACRTLAQHIQERLSVAGLNRCDHTPYKTFLDASLAHTKRRTHTGNTGVKVSDAVPSLLKQTAPLTSASHSLASRTLWQAQAKTQRHSMGKLPTSIFSVGLLSRMPAHKGPHLRYIWQYSSTLYPLTPKP